MNRPANVMPLNCYVSVGLHVRYAGFFWCVADLPGVAAGMQVDCVMGVEPNTMFVTLPGDESGIWAQLLGRVHVPPLTDFEALAYSRQQWSSDAALQHADSPAQFVPPTAQVADLPGTQDHRPAGSYRKSQRAAAGGNTSAAQRAGLPVGPAAAVCAALAIAAFAGCVGFALGRSALVAFQVDKPLLCQPNAAFSTHTTAICLEAPVAQRLRSHT